MNHDQSDVHPIELFLAALLSFLEGTCWVINELAGHHPSPLARSLQHNNARATQTTSNKPTPAPTPTRSPRDLGSTTSYATLTVKQLQATTGVRSSRYRKSDLIQLAVQQAERGELVHA